MTTATDCVECSLPGYLINSEGECEEECGDGRRPGATHECDDGNTENGDGCDSFCRIEPNYSCEGGAASSEDFCTLRTTLLIESVSVTPQFELIVQLNEAVHFSGRLG